jgi:hypothetical protein
MLRSKDNQSTAESIGVNMGQHLCGTLSTPCSVQIEAVLMAKWIATQY